MFIFSFLATIGATFLGALFSKFSKNINQEVFKILQNMSVGGIIALVFFELFIEAKENLSSFLDNEFLGATYTLLIGLGSGLLFFLLHELTHKLTHHHHDDENDEENCYDHAHSTELFKDNNLLASSIIFLLAIFAHNIPEGLSLGITFLNINSLNIPLDGIVMSTILFIHNLLIGFIMFNSFINSNKSAKFSFLMTLLSSLPAFALAIFGYFITNIDISSLFQGILFSFSMGSLLYVLFIELLPQTTNQYKSKYSFLYIMLGIIISGVLIAIE